MLIVLAHPDDESFGMGGTIAHYARLGVEIALMCATRGEAGSVAAELLEGGTTIPELREDELRCAAAVLGIKHLELMGFRDSGMAGSPDNEHPASLVQAPMGVVTEQVVRRIRAFRPDVVITFDPVGGYHHPDHLKIQRATVEAFAAAGDGEKFPDAGEPFQPGQLYFSVFPRRIMRTLVKTLDWLNRRRLAHWLAARLGKKFPNPRKFGRNQDIDLVTLAGDEDYPEHVLVDYREVLELKERADACHASQLDFGRQSGNRFVRWASRLQRRQDRFMRAYPETAAKFKANDLFFN